MNAEEWLNRRLAQTEHGVVDVRARLEGLELQFAWMLRQLERIRQELPVSEDEGSYA